MKHLGKQVGKHLGKLLAAILAATLALALAAVAWADGDDGSTSTSAQTGSITIENATPEKTYTAYKIFDASYSTDGSVAYVASKELKELAENTTITVGDVQKNVSELLTFTATSSEDLFNVSVAEGVDDETVRDAVAALVDAAENDNSVTFTTRAETAGNSGKVEFSGLALGYYYVTVPSESGFIASLTTTAPAATIIDKNQSPAWGALSGGAGSSSSDGKTIIAINGTEVSSSTRVSASYGDELTYKVTFVATNYVGTNQVGQYYVCDTLGEGLEYVWTGGEGEAVGTVPAATDVTVTVERSDATDANVLALTPTLSNDGKSFQIAIPWATLDEGGSPYTSLYTSTATVTVTYKVRVTDKASVAGEEDNTVNKAKFGYHFTSAAKTDENGNVKVDGDGKVEYPEFDPENPGNGGGVSANDATTSVVTFALGIYKVDGEGNSLSGATFTVETEDGKLLAAKEVEPGTGVYNFARYVADDSELLEGETTEFVSGSADDYKGEIVIKGVAGALLSPFSSSDANVTYTVRETKAPAGYNLMTDAVTLSPCDGTFGKQSSYAQSLSKTIDSDGNEVAATSSGARSVSTTFTVPVTADYVVNQAGVLLPSTGGAGLVALYIGGAAAVVAGVVLLVLKKRRASRQ